MMRLLLIPCMAPCLQVLKINEKDTVLTLTSGGCNSLNLLLHGAGHVSPTDVAIEDPYRK